jgi:AAA family ATP:ADP antiporter
MSTGSPIQQIMAVRREEWGQVLPMSAYFFLVIATFWILRPLKSGLFVEFYDQTPFEFLGWSFNAAQAQNLAKVGNMVVALAAAAAFARLARRFQRERLTWVFCAFSIACLGLFAWVLQFPGAATVWSFYWFGDLYNTLMVATFFAFLNDSVRPESAKRLYGLIVLGGVTGGAFGSLVLSRWITALPISGWMWVAAGATLGVAMVAGLAGRQVPGAALSEEGASSPPRASIVAAGRMVLGSKYLLAIVAIVGLYEMASTIMDFQFTSTISYYLDGEAISIQFSRVFAVTNGVAFLVQLFLTSFVMTRFGVGTALLVLPVAALLGSVAFMAAPILLFGGLLNTADSGFNYSINQSARETLYTPATRAEKYQAKAFIDMFVIRFAKAVAVGLSLVITMLFTGFASIRWLSLVTLGILVAWILVARFAGRAFRERSGEAGFSSSSPSAPIPASDPRS